MGAATAGSVDLAMPGDEGLRAGALAAAIGALTVGGLLLYIRPEQSRARGRRLR